MEVMLAAAASRFGGSDASFSLVLIDASRNSARLQLLLKASVLPKTKAVAGFYFR
jgi:hypothetical protein